MLVVIPCDIRDISADSELVAVIIHTIGHGCGNIIEDYMYCAATDISEVVEEQNIEIERMRAIVDKYTAPIRTLISPLVENGIISEETAILYVESIGADTVINIWHEY